MAGTAPDQLRIHGQRPSPSHVLPLELPIKHDSDPEEPLVIRAASHNLGIVADTSHADTWPISMRSVSVIRSHRDASLASFRSVGGNGPGPEGATTRGTRPGRMPRLIPSAVRMAGCPLLGLSSTCHFGPSPARRLKVVSFTRGSVTTYDLAPGYGSHCARGATVRLGNTSQRSSRASSRE